MITTESTSTDGAVVLARVHSLSGLADAWIANGATALEIHLGESCVWRHGAPLPAGTAMLSARLVIGGCGEFEMRVGGVSGRANQRRLEAEAELLGESLRLDDELQGMTGELIETQDQLLALFGLARAMRRHLNLDEVLAEFVAEVCRLTGAELAFVLVPDVGAGRLVCHPTPPEAWRDVLFRASTRVKSSGTLLLTDGSADRLANFQVPPFVSNLVAVPVEIDGRAEAVLGLLNQREARFSAGTVKLLQALGEQAGGLVESADLHERALAQERLRREMELAAAIQAALMPRAALVVPGIELAARFRPATDVGGDFYDYRLRPDGQLALCVGDVSGKGWPAALVMTMTLAVLRSASQFVDRPAVVAQRANADLYEDLTSVDAFVTAFVGYYDSAAAWLAFASAGHSPVIYRARSGRSRLLHATNLPLGVMLEPLRGGDAVRMGPGDLLVVATDGFSEAINPDGELFGYARLLALVESIATTTAAAAADRMCDVISAFADGRAQEDDQTLLIVKGC